MKISTLIDREPFSKIFEKTIILFLYKYSGIKHTVKWKKKTLLDFNNVSGQCWQCNPLINSIFVKNANKHIFNSINGEYLFTPSKPWRSVIQRFYLLLSESKLTSGFLSKYTIEISPPIDDAENKLIIGGNNKIRIIDLTSKSVFVILKDGFDRKYLDREIFVRSEYQYLPIPKIIKFNRNDLWYCEEYITGVSPNRLEKKEGEGVLYASILCLHKMLNETKVNKTLEEYTQSLYMSMSLNVKKILNFDKNTMESIVKIFRTLLNYIGNDANKYIDIAYCHGDFHQGNILTNGNEYWILDWEHSGYKQICHDLILLLIESRLVNGYSDRLTRLVNNKLEDDQFELVKIWPNIDWNNNPIRKIYIALFILEDLNFYIEESVNQVFYENSTALIPKIKEMTKFVNCTYEKSK